MTRSLLVAGGGPAFTPLSLSPSLWLPAGSANLSVTPATIDPINPPAPGSCGPRVDTRIDRSGNGRNFTQTGVNRPGTTKFGGLDTCDHVGTHPDYPTSAAQASTILGTGQYYVAVAFRANLINSIGPADYYDRALLSVLTGYWGLSVGGGLKMTHFDSGTYKTTSPIAISTGGTHVAEGWFDGSAIHCAYDGTEATPVAAAALNAGFATNVMLTGYQFDGAIGDIIVIKGATTAPQRAQVRAYLASKFAAPAQPSGHGNLGRVLYFGDSITLGSAGFTGGWRKEVENLALAQGVTWSAVGPVTSSSGTMSKPGHFGLSGRDTAQALSDVRAIVAQAYPDRIVWALTMNSIAHNITPAIVITQLTTLLDTADLVGPSWLQHVVQTVTYPTAAAPAGYYDHVTSGDYADLQSRIATFVAGRARCTLANVGQPTVSDGIHPIDGAGGYPIMAQPTLDALVSST